MLVSQAHLNSFGAKCDPVNRLIWLNSVTAVASMAASSHAPNGRELAFITYFP